MEEKEGQSVNNPFSFKRFLKTIKDENLEDDSQNKQEEKKEIEENHDENKDSNILDDSNTSKSSKEKNKKLLIIDDSVPAEDSVYHISSKYENMKNSYSDSEESFESVSPQSESYILHENISTTKDFELLAKITNLTEENENLQEDLKEVRNEFFQYRVTANKRISNLQRELERSRVKDADETRTMEEVVRMVESNLEAMTTRALKAEAIVTRLNEEIKFFKDSHVPSSQYNRLLEEHTHLIHTINEKSINAATLMRSAAEKTEPYLRQLQSGVSSLYFLADQFDDITKIADLSIEGNVKKKDGDVT